MTEPGRILAIKSSITKNLPFQFVDSKFTALLLRRHSKREVFVASYLAEPSAALPTYRWKRQQKRDLSMLPRNSLSLLECRCKRELADAAFLDLCCEDVISNDADVPGFGRRYFPIAKFDTRITGVNTPIPSALLCNPQLKS
jgi:hypothetical protein